MNEQPPDPLQSNSSNCLNGASDSSNGLDSASPVRPAVHHQSEEELAQLRQEDTRAMKSSLQRLFAVLIAAGLAVGAVVSIGIALLLDRFDLSPTPTQVDRSE